MYFLFDVSTSICDTPFKYGGIKIAIARDKVATQYNKINR